MLRTSSVVMASTPQPKDTSWISCMSSCVVTYFAAAYSREWYIHWFSTFTGNFCTSALTTSSEMTAAPQSQISWSMPWLISGST